MDSVTFDLPTPQKSGEMAKGNASADCTYVNAPLSQLAPCAETVLVVEDERCVLSFVCQVLAGEGYKVLRADSPGGAACMVETYAEPIHLLLTDVVMPEMSGRGLAHRMSAAHPETRVLYMSGYSDDRLMGEEMLTPRTFVLHKPFSPSALARKVREVLDTNETGANAGGSA
jgi:DNA-binding NtrC family response regulator